MLSKEVIDAFKIEGFTFEEIQDIIESEEEFEETGIVYSLDEVKDFARKDLFSKAEVHV